MEKIEPEVIAAHCPKPLLSQGQPKLQSHDTM